MLRRSADVHAASLDNTTLLLNTQRSLYHSLNPVATRIWDLLAEPTTEPLLVARLIQEFDVSPDVCRVEVAEFLAALRDRDLLVSD